MHYKLIVFARFNACYYKYPTTMLQKWCISPNFLNCSTCTGMYMHYIHTYVGCMHAYVGGLRTYADIHAHIQTPVTMW